KVDGHSAPMRVNAPNNICIYMHCQFPLAEEALSLGLQTSAIRGKFTWSGTGVRRRQDRADDLVQQAVARDRLALVLGPTHPWASRRSIKGPDLLAAEWVLRERGSGTRSEFEDVLKLWALSADKLNVVLELPSNEAVRMAVEAGAGATVISRLVAEPSLR